MPKIVTYVIFDVETTGLPYQERNQTKIIEACYIAVSVKDIECTDKSDLPPVSKLSFTLNPTRPINPEVTALTGISNKMLQNSQTFAEKFRTIRRFLQDLPRPVCLVAHNGNSFDFKILLAECRDLGVQLPEDILCLDSLIGLRKLIKDSNMQNNSFDDGVTKISKKSQEMRISDSGFDDLLTDDEDDFPECLEDGQYEKRYYKTPSDFLNDINKPKEGDSEKETKCNTREEIISKVFEKQSPNINTASFKLTDLYKRLLFKEAHNAHRAEADCIMLLECIIAMNKEFVPWSYSNCKLLKDIKPLNRY